MVNDITYDNAYEKFKLKFNENNDFFIQKENELSVDNSDGAHIKFGTIVIPYLYHLVDLNNVTKIKECFSFFDDMSKSKDKELTEVVQFSILEDIVTDEEYYNKLKDYFTEEIKTYLPYLHNYLLF